MALLLRIRVLFGFILLVVSFCVLADHHSTSAVTAVFPEHFPPQHFSDLEGQPDGFAIEVMKEVSELAGVPIYFHPVRNWTEVFSEVREGRAQIVPNMGITEQRRKIFFFTKPYEHFHIRIFVRKESTDINGLNDLRGKVVSTTETNVANGLVSQLNPLRFSDSSQVVNALLNGRVDAIVLPDVVVQRIAANNRKLDGIKAVGEPLKTIGRAIAVSRQSPEVFAKINYAFDKYINSSTFQDTLSSWHRTTNKNLSVRQLSYINICLALIVLGIVGVTLRRKLRSQDPDISEANIGVRVASLIGILFVATMLATAVTLSILYDAAFEGQKERLVNIVQSRAKIIESVARFDLANRDALGLTVEETYLGTISQVKEAHDSFSGIGSTGEFTLARRNGDEIAFILRQRHNDMVEPKNIKWDSPHAEPMRRALSESSGTLVGLDYRGIKVLAAHEPVAVINAGIVAKIDLEEIQKPYIRAGLIALAISFGILLLGVGFFMVLTMPILSRLTFAFARLRAIVENSPSLIHITDNAGNTVISSPRMHEIKGEILNEGESKICHRDGSQHTYLTHSFDLLTPNKVNFGHCQIATDISKRVAAESGLRQLALAFESTSEGMMITDLEGQITTVNRAFTRITGYSEKEIIGAKPSVIRSGRHDTDFYQYMWEQIINTGEWSGEIWNRRKNGEIYPEWLNINTVFDSNDMPSHYVAVFSDISTLKESQEQLHHLAHHDPLTELANRLLFKDRLEHAIENAHREENLVVLFALDIDQFKRVNDSLGHPAGDALLVQIARRLENIIRENDTVARIGGDEFTIIAEKITSLTAVYNLADKLINCMSHDYDLDGQAIRSSVSMGVAVYPQDGRTPDELLKNADTALYKAKEQGRNNYQLYTEELSRKILDKLVMENQILKGMHNDEFVLYYQPQFDITTGELVSAEALVRWNHPDMGLLSPDKFIPIAEENGLIVPLGEWILRAACEQAKQWLDKGFMLQNVAVNLAGKQIDQTNLFNTVKETLESTKLPSDKLELEVTEGFIMKEGKASISILESLRSLGITIAIDDFGTGYSSLAYLKRLPIRTLKIDRSFVMGLPKDDEDVAISKAVIALGHSLGMKIIAEGVESQAQLDFLKAEKCEIMQGYLKGKPELPHKFEEKFLATTSA